MIAVVGSVNRDVVVTVDRLPEPGETVVGADHFESPGGKGANQAVAAARLGADVSFYGAVGDDPPGRALVAGLAAEGVATTGVRLIPDVPTGLAVITVDAAGENTIVVVPGANAALGTEDVAEWSRALAAADVLLLQQEVPVAVVAAAVTVATGTVVLNPAPARPVDVATLAAVDVLVPNRSEAALLADSDRLGDLAALGPLVVVTLGAEGAAIVDSAGVTAVPAPQVTAVDTTGAGDAFCGALAASLASGASLRAAVDRAVGAGALATTRSGARSAMPTNEALDAFMTRESG